MCASRKEFKLYNEKLFDAIFPLDLQSMGITFLREKSLKKNKGNIKTERIEKVLEKQSEYNGRMKSFLDCNQALIDWINRFNTGVTEERGERGKRRMEEDIEKLDFLLYCCGLIPWQLNKKKTKAKKEGKEEIEKGEYKRGVDVEDTRRDEKEFERGASYVIVENISHDALCKPFASFIKKCGSAAPAKSYTFYCEQLGRKPLTSGQHHFQRLSVYLGHASVEQEFAWVGQNRMQYTLFILPR